MMLQSLSQDFQIWISHISIITILGMIIFSLGLFAYLITRWTECLLVWTLALCYALLPFLPS